MNKFIPEDVMAFSIFQGESILDYLSYLENAEFAELRNKASSFFEKSPLHDIIIQIMNKFKRKRPILKFSDISQKPFNTMVSRKYAPGENMLLPRGSKDAFPSNIIRIYIPYSGDGVILKYKPSMSYNWTVKIKLETGYVCFDILNLHNQTDSLKGEIKQKIDRMKTNYEFLMADLNKFEAEFPIKLGNFIKNRIAHLNSTNVALGELGIKKFEEPYPELEDQGPNQKAIKEYDVFICHASEDKGEIAEPLAEHLKRIGLKVWYDKFVLKVGDSLRRKIDEGLVKSRFGIIILSESFFKKEWPQRELDGLASREIKGKKMILPIWHNIDYDYVMEYSPTLADRYALNTSNRTLEQIIGELLKVI